MVPTVLIKLWHTRIAGMDYWDGLGPGPGNVLFIGGMSSLLLACPQPRFRNVWPDFPWVYLFQNVSVNDVPSVHTC